MFPAISDSLSRVVAHDTAVVNLWDEERQSYTVLVPANTASSEFAPAGMVLEAEDSFTPRILETHPQGTVVRRAEMAAARRTLRSCERR